MTLALSPVATDEDFSAAIRIHNDVLPGRAVTDREMREYLAVLVEHREILGISDGEPVAVGSVAVEATHRARAVGSTLVAVLPQARGLGVGSALLQALAAWAGAHGLTTLEGWIEETDPAALAWAERRGFREVGRESKLVLELAAAEAPASAPPEEIEIRTLAERPELVHGLYEVACEAYPDIPGCEDEPLPTFEDWLREDLEGPSDRAEAVFVALAGDELVGYSKFHLPEARPTVAHHDITGVKRAWRGRGIAGALKRAQIAWARGAGYERLETMNELRNLPIRRLNERLGYREAPGRVLVRGPLPGE